MEDLALNDREKVELLKAASLQGYYCQGCRECVGQCLQKLPIPDLMRAYMYTYGYRNLAMAQDLVLSLSLPKGVCEDCSTCPVACPSGFNVPAKVRDVARLRDVPTEFIA